MDRHLDVGAAGVERERVVQDSSSSCHAQRSALIFKFAPKSSFCTHIELRLVGVGPRRVLRVFPLNEIDPEIAELLELLHAREQFDEIAQLFEQSSRPWHQYSEEERNQLVARAALMMSRGPS